MNSTIQNLNVNFKEDQDIKMPKIMANETKFSFSNARRASEQPYATATNFSPAKFKHKHIRKTSKLEEIIPK